jgi:TPR repeat protein
LRIGSYKEVADTGNSSAQYNYAVMLMMGDGIPKDVEEGIKYCILSAEAGYPSASHAMALRYASGDGVEQYKKLAFYFYSKAAEKNTLNHNFN